MVDSISSPGAQTQVPVNSVGDAVHFNFTAPAGYFLPSLDSTTPETFDPTTTNFGLISQPYDTDSTLSGQGQDNVSRTRDTATDWQRLEHHMEMLNAGSAPNTSYHILYLARHGQGYHNLAESYYGAQAWNCYWSELDGDLDSSITWSDTHLSKLGQQQAREQTKFWKSQLQEQKMPPPQAWFVSPMERACKTLQITFEDLARNGIVHGWIPLVKEMLRETNGIHTCDRRSPKSIIEHRYPGYQIERGFTEKDEFWDPVYRETDAAHTHRAALLLDDVLSNLQTTGTKKGRYISLTAHGGMINAILRAIGHREFQVNVGSAIAVFVKAEMQDGKRPTPLLEKGTTKPECIDDPLKAGLPGYKNLKGYVDEVEAAVEDSR